LWIFAPPAPQKSRLTGVLRSLQGKKAPVRRFLEVLRAKRNKLLAAEKIFFEEKIWEKH
jgi:hypothetical protein